MSLITLSSGDNTKPYLFSSYFPQPIKIPSGSQVCVLKFIHFRNEETFLINNMNSKLFFCIGNTKNDGIFIYILRALLVVLIIVDKDKFYLN